MEYGKRALIWASVLALVLCQTIPNTFCSPNEESLPGVFDVASNGQLAVSVMDMQKCDSVQGFFLALGLVVENMQNITIQVDPSTFNVQDSHGEMINASKEYALKYPLIHCEVNPGEVVVGSLGFKLNEEAMPAMFLDQSSGLRIRLDKASKPPGIPHSLGVPIKTGDCIVGIEGLSQSQDGRILQIDYLLKNFGPGVMLLEPRDYGRFGNLIDASGFSIPASDYKMLGPAVPPGGTLEGYLTYTIPYGSDPLYLIFWPPEEDAVLFDLGLQSRR